MEPRHIIRAAIAVSVLAHIALAVGVFFADARPFDPLAGQDIAVDMVTPEQVAEVAREADKTKPPEPEKQPDPFRLPELTNKPTVSESRPQGSAAPEPPASSPSPAAQQPPPSGQTPEQQPSQQQAAQQAVQQEQSQPQQQAQPPAEAQQQPPPQQQPQQQASLQPVPEQSSQSPAKPEPDITVKYGVMLGLPDGNGGSEAITKADIAPLDIAAFRRHLKSCSKLPSAVGRGDNVRIVLRAFLSPAGKLMTEPMLIEASASVKGPLLMQAAMKALETCQPYAMLPADKYNEWKVLDLSFTPQDFAG